MAPFSHIQRLQVGRSVFNLSYEKKFTADFGKLYPVMCDECVPGDIFTLGHEVVMRLNPLIAPILHNVSIKTEYFFVPYRLLWELWEDFITGGSDGNFAVTPPLVNQLSASIFTDDSIWVEGELLDFLGLNPIPGTPAAVAGPTMYDCKASSFPAQAYNFIWNEWYRDENLQAEIGDDPTPSARFTDNAKLLYRNYRKDYFSSALPWQQKGTPPALPISGFATVDYPNLNGTSVVVNNGVNEYLVQTDMTSGSNVINPHLSGNSSQSSTDSPLNINKATWEANLAGSGVDLSLASTFNVSDLRLAFQVQKWLERNARAGSRYTEFLRAHFPASPKDERLDRPEYLGGWNDPVIISEVLQTSRSEAGSTAQGNLAGHGIAVSKGGRIKYHVQEFGLIMGLMSIVPAPAYQQGINRQWTRATKYDYYFPEFAHLSEQGVVNKELYVSTTDGDNEKIFGYQGRYDEMRTKHDMVHGAMRSTLDYWHLGRQFGTRPNLNEDFIKMDDVRAADVFAVPSEPGFIVNWRNDIKAVRPMPILGTPGLIDHN